LPIFNQQTKIMSTAILYHQVKPGVDCPDGIAAAYAAYRKMPFKHETDLIGCVYGQEPPSVENYRNIIIVDFSFDRATIERWSETRSVVLLDHHKTALEMLGDVSTLSGQIYSRIDLNECGATLSWEYFNSLGRPPAIFEYVRDRDLWNFELRLSEEIHEAVAHLRYKLKELATSVNLDETLLVFSLFDQLIECDRQQLVDRLAPLGAKLLAPKREKIAAAAARYQMGLLPDPDTHPVAIPIVNCAADGSEDRLVSDICAKLYRDMPEHLFVACITSDGKWSLRSDKHGSDYDVAAIAQHYGGGGHKNAAGFSVRSN
jgi:uncharacterized protein